MNHPTPTPDTGAVPGIRDYEVRMPFTRTGPDGTRQDACMVERIPAGGTETAIALATAIATYVGTDNTPDDGGEKWAPIITAITVTDVDRTPNPAHLAAELNHYKRILAALVARFPMVLQVTRSEYDAVDPDTVRPVQVDSDTMAFLPSSLMATGVIPAGEPLLLPGKWTLPITDAQLGVPGLQVWLDDQWWNLEGIRPDAETRQITVLARNPKTNTGRGFDAAINTKLRLRDAQPYPYGGHDDPDVRRVRAGRLAEIGTRFEILVGGRWVRVELVYPSPDGDDMVFVHCRSRDGGHNSADDDLVFPHPSTLITVRPAVIEAFGTDLQDAAGGREIQILTATGWWYVLLAAEKITGTTSVWEVTGARGNDKDNTKVSNDAPVLLREIPRRWS